MNQPYPLLTLHHGWAAQDVVGTSHYMPQILAMLGGDYRPDGRDSAERVVELVAELDNPHDRTAVSVRWRNGVVGHLPRDDAARYHPHLRGLAHNGFAPTVRARIWAGERTDWSLDRPITTPSAHVTLFLSGPEAMVPVNDPPATAYTLLPDGSSVQVLKTVDHFVVLNRYPPPTGVGNIIVTLHPAELRTRNTVKRYVEVRLDDSRIGQLSPATSEKYLPAVDHLTARGLATAARAVLTGSAVSATVSLFAQKAFELSRTVLDGAPQTIPSRGIPVPTQPARLIAAPIPQRGKTPFGSPITVVEDAATGVTTVRIEFGTPLTPWQQKVASKVIAAAAGMLAAQRLSVSPSQLSATRLEAAAPIEVAQEFVDAFFGIEDSDFTGANGFGPQPDGRN